ncbi:uncharacterized protein LOC124285797 [Haliotis rubra]|uniref:uncharacterized protein LOC124285797 n=1 Tax=Haliotis rubra TaxID=36100 RepID=UPI001EE549A0|nr:uncharacterized protein LOC124285797 [Haliotis rubra]
MGELDCTYTDDSATEAYEEPQPKRAKSSDLLSQLCDSGPSTTESPKPSSSKSKPDDEFFQEIHEQLMDKERTSEPVNTLLAGIVDDLMFKTSRPDDSKVKEKMEATLTLRPVNCASLVPTRVDELIWTLMKPNTQTVDKKLQKTQAMIVKTVCILTKVIDNLYTLKDEIMRDGISAIEMASIANCDLNIRRRDLIKPDVHTSYMPLFSSTIPVNAYLFGGEAPKRLDDIEKSNMACHQPVSSENRKRGSNSTDNSQDWPTQHWYAILMGLLVDHPRRLPRRMDLLTLPHNSELHPLRKKMTLLACFLSGKQWRSEEYRRTLTPSSFPRGGSLLKNSIKSSFRSGKCAVIKGKLIPFVPL